MKNKKGKKLVVLGAMAALLTLIGVSGSQTYAKYVENAEVGTQVATVAKWGFVITGDSSELFANKHQKDAVNGSTKHQGGAGVLVTAEAGSEIVAPGTSGKITFGVSGVAEVRSKLTFTVSTNLEITLLEDDGLGNKTALYKPVLWTLKEVNSLTPLVENSEDFQDIETALEGLNSTFSPNTTVNATYELSYSWPFDLSVHAHSNNTYDTYIGKLANGYTGEAVPSNLSIIDTLSFSIGVSIEQVQI